MRPRSPVVMETSENKLTSANNEAMNLRRDINIDISYAMSERVSFTDFTLKALVSNCKLFFRVSIHLLQK